MEGFKRIAFGSACGRAEVAWRVFFLVSTMSGVSGTGTEASMKSNGRRLSDARRYKNQVKAIPDTLRQLMNPLIIQ